MSDIGDVLDGRKQWCVEQGDSLQLLAGIPDDSIACCVTSPPYFSLRSYLADSDPDKHLELGREKVPDCFGWATGARCGACYVCKLTAVFREVRRVLKDDGTFWLNTTISYASGGNGPGRKDSKQRTNGNAALPAKKAPDGWKPKDIVNIPALLAESLRVDGWFVRAEICLTKLSPMPESTNDRPTRATEKLYLFSKKPRYFYDKDAERVKSADSTICRDKYTRITAGNEEEQYAAKHDHETISDPEGRNLWDYWDDDTPDPVWVWHPEGGGPKHVAKFPTWLPRRCLRLGTRWRQDPCDDVVLEPFSGSGTTGHVAREMGLRFIGLELNRDYARISRERIAGVSPLFDSPPAITTPPEVRKTHKQTDLFGE